MVFAVEEINHSKTVLPGVKLGYHIFDSCGRPPWALQAALSLVGGDSTSCNSTDPPDYSTGYGEGIRERRGSLLCIHIILHMSKWNDDSKSNAKMCLKGKQTFFM